MQIQLNSQERNWGKRETSTSLFEIEKIQKIVPIYEFKFSIHDVVLIVSRRKIRKCLKKKQLYGTFLWMVFNCLKATATSRRQFTFSHSVPRNSWYSFYRPRKDERLSRPWSHPLVLNTGSLDWESSALTTCAASSFCVFDGMVIEVS